MQRSITVPLSPIKTPRAVASVGAMNVVLLDLNLPEC